MINKLVYTEEGDERLLYLIKPICSTANPRHVIQLLSKKQKSTLEVEQIANARYYELEISDEHPNKILHVTKNLLESFKEYSKDCQTYFQQLLLTTANCDTTGLYNDFCSKSDFYKTLSVRCTKSLIICADLNSTDILACQDVGEKCGKHAKEHIVDLPSFANELNFETNSTDEACIEYYESMMETDGLRDQVERFYRNCLHSNS